MTITLGGVSLSEDLIWEDEFDSNAIGQNARLTIHGATVVQSMPISDNRTVTLVAAQRGSSIYGYYTRVQILQFKAWEAAGSTLSFVYDTTTVNVVILAGGVQMKPLLAKQGQGVDDYYLGSLAMRVV